MAKEHKKSESYQLTRSLRSAVLSHSSSCSYVTCRSGFQFTFAREPLLLLLPPTMLIAAWSCVRAHWENSPTHTGTEEDGTFFRSPAARRLLRRVLWRFRPVVSFLTLYVWSDCQIRSAGRTTTTVKAVSVLVVENGKLAGYTVVLCHCNEQVVKYGVYNCVDNGDGLTLL